MGYSKTIPLGSVLSLTLAEIGGVGTVTISGGAKVGGGSVAGFENFNVSITDQVSAIQLADAGMLALEAKFPALAGAIATFKLLVDAEAAKL